MELGSFSELPWQMKIGAGVGMSLGASLLTYLEYMDQKCYYKRKSLGACYFNLFVVANFGGLLGSILGPIGMILWPIPCFAAVAASFGIGAKCIFSD